MHKFDFTKVIRQSPTHQRSAVRGVAGRGPTLLGWGSVALLVSARAGTSKSVQGTQRPNHPRGALVAPGCHGYGRQLWLLSSGLSVIYFPHSSGFPPIGLRHPHDSSTRTSVQRQCSNTVKLWAQKVPDSLDSSWQRRPLSLFCAHHLGTGRMWNPTSVSYQREWTPSTFLLATRGFSPSWKLKPGNVWQDVCNITVGNDRHRNKRRYCDFCVANQHKFCQQPNSVAGPLLMQLVSESQVHH